MNTTSNTSRYDYERTISEQFEKITRLFPDKVAIVGKNEQISYSQLAYKVDILSSLLSSIETDFVYMLFEHDTLMIVAMLGVLKSAKAYVPMDPSHPMERLERIASNSNGKLILTDNKNVKYAETLSSAIQGIQVINLDNSLRNDNYETTQNRNTGDDLAYVLYTSGSTGQPKGVVQNNENILYYIKNYSKNLEITDDDRLSLFPTYCFDASVMDIYAALLNGATLYPYRIRESGSVDFLPEWLHDNKITIFHSTPTLFRNFSLKVEGRSSMLTSIRLVVMGGEQVLINDVDIYKRYFPENCVFINGLGPTESTVTLQCFIRKDTELLSSVVPVGTPIDEMNVFICDDEGNEIEGNVVGELAYRCKHLALGYLNMPEETRKMFTVDASDPTIRIFRSGDLGRKNESGQFEFHGRADFQMKIRGQRIELGEIESALDKNEKIIKSIVVPVSLGRLSKIIAYVILKDDIIYGEDEIKTYLLSILPSYMMPSYFIQVPDFPTTSTGKIDRKQLIQDFLKNPQYLSSEIITPRNETEKAIFEIWSNVLRKTDFGVSTTFEAAGGDSLSATSVAVELETVFGTTVELSQLAEFDTIEKQVSLVSQKNELKKDSNIFLLKRQTQSDKNLFFIHAGNGEIQNYILLCNKLRVPFNAWAIRSDRFNDYQPKNESLIDVSARYVKQIQEIQPTGPYFIVGWCFGGIRAFEIARQLESKKEKVAFLGIINSHAPYSTTKEIETVVSNYSLLDFSPNKKIAFSCDSERLLAMKWLKKANLSLTEIEEGNIWENIVKKVKSDLDMQGLIRVIKMDIPDDRAQAIPFYDNITLADLLYYLAVMRSDSNSQAFYSPGGCVNVSINYFSAKLSQVINRAEWAKFTNGSLNMFDINGNHFSIFEEYLVDELVDVLCQSLEKIED